MKKVFFFVFIYLMVYTLISCSAPEDDENLMDLALVEKKLNERIDEFMLSRLLACRLSTLEDAETHVDTLIASLISFDIMQGIPFPTLPQRPKFPKQIILDDSTKVRPIFEDQ